MQVSAKDRVIEVVKKDPTIKEKLIEYSNDFNKLKDPWIFNLVANLATFEELAEFTGTNLSSLLDYLNKGVRTTSEATENTSKPEWLDKYRYVEIDARNLKGFFLKDILAKEAELNDETGLKVIQNFYAAPLITLLESKGYEHYSEKLADDLFHFYFVKKKSETPKNVNVVTSSKPQMVVQSATPVVYPVLLKLLASEEVKKRIEVTEYKVWEETEKHLGWIVNGKADLSFSAILAMSNLTNNKDIVTLTSIAVWDNFYLLTRGYEAKDWSDIKGHDIYMPLFQNAPPAKVTHYLMKNLGYDPKEFNFVYGKPFGRPEEIYRDLTEGKIDTALLREPEVSYALVNNSEIKVAFSYNELWQKIHPQSKGLPNAGVVFKSEWMEKYPEEAKLLMEEIDKAIAWVRKNPKEAAEFSYKEMGHSFDEVYKFLTRVHFENVDALSVEKEIVEYLAVIEGEERATKAVSKMLQKNHSVIELEA